MARRKSTSGSRRPSGSSSRSSRRRSGRSSAPRLPRLNLTLNGQQKALVAGILFIFATAIVVLSLLSPNQGQLTTALSESMWLAFGWGGIIVPIVTAVGGFFLVLWGMEQGPQLPALRLVGLLLLFLALEAFASMAWVAWDNGLNDVWAVAQAGEGGGYLGGALVWLSNKAVGQLGTVFVFLVIGVVAVLLTSGVSRADLGAFLTGLAHRRPKEETGARELPREIPLNTGRTAADVQQASLAASRAGAAAAAAAARPVPQPSRSAAQPAVAASPAQGKTGRAARQGRPAQPQAAEPNGQATPVPVFLSVQDGQSWTPPDVAEMLESGGNQDIGDAYIRDQVAIIEHTLESFGAPATVVEINQGPTITQYGVEPNFVEQRSGKRTKVKVGKIASLADDLALALAARSIRIQAPVPGKGYVGIEVPNTEKALVSLRDVMESAEFKRIPSPLRIGLGQNVAGQPIATDLTQMPHLLIAGTTGSGKSVCVNSLVACLLLQNTPDDLKLVMVDPKRVELTGFNGIPHLVAPVVVDLERVVGTLQWAMREMDSRYRRLADLGARNIADFNQKAGSNGQERMPYIVIVIDELADLMILSPEETERSITRLAQLARATGIHMVIATQRPSVDVVTGLIKANFPARIAFAVASSTDSRVILDTTGAERLLGQGDMLFQSPDAAAPLRMQGCFVSEKELHNIIDYWRSARRTSRIQTQQATAESGEVEAAKAAPEPAPHQQPLWEEMRQAEEDAAKYADELLPEAIEMVRHLGKASTSLLQRRFRIGYTRAARLMDIMEEDGVIGPPTGTSKAREVLPISEEEGSGEESPAEDLSESSLDKESEGPSLGGS